mmetsp:Transcript_3100/g.4738  ORF Transcript_3100/g.4738 Transcript_3100/m.4738 type:complete len:168 (-) Transcript_3100:659-1162(-)
MANTYHTGLCDCLSDPTICCITCLCPSITVAQTKQKFDRSSDFISNWIPVLLVDCLSGNLGSAMFGCQHRQQFRAAWNIPGDTVSDCLLFCCCTCCAVSQDAREFKLQQKLSADRRPAGDMIRPEHVVITSTGQQMPVSTAVVMGSYHAPGSYYPAPVPAPPMSSSY